MGAGQCAEYVAKAKGTKRRRRTRRRFWGDGLGAKGNLSHIRYSSAALAILCLD